MGKGGGKAHTPREERDNLKSQQQVQIVDLLSEGPIEGPVGDLKGVMLNDTPAVNADDSVNFHGFTVEWRSGTQEQTALEGFAESGSEVSVGGEVKKSTPVTRTITSANIDMLRVTLGVPALVETESDGDRVRSSVTLDVQVEREGVWMSEATVVFDGKTTSTYERAVRFGNLPPRPFNIRVVRVTDDSSTDTLQNKTSWVGYTEIITVRQRYPNSAVVGITALADYFGGQLPRRNYHIRGRVVQVPDNYDPVTRTYTALWQGQFKPAWTDNPAWCLHDLLTHPRYGLGRRIHMTDVDKWALYVIAQYCDQPVPDGFGGTEPRARLNASLIASRTAYEVIGDMCSVMRCMPVWNGTQMTFVQDRPADSAWVYTNSSVVNGLFSYTYSALKDRHNAVYVRWTDPGNGWQTTTEYVSDDASIALNGYHELKVDAFGCTSRGQAHRLGLWLITTAQLEIQTVTFSTGAQGLRHLPGDIIEVADNDYGGLQVGGRVLAADPAALTLTLDRDVELPAGQTYITLPGGDGKPVRLVVDSSLAANRLYVPGLPATVQSGDIWGLSLPTLTRRLFRCVSVSEKSDGTFEVTALQHAPEKETIVDNGATFNPNPGTAFTTRIPPVEHLRADTDAVADGYRVTAYWDTPKVVNGLRFEVVIKREGREVMRLTTADTLVAFSLSEQGNYTLQVCGTGSRGERGEPAEVALAITAPPAPQSIDIVAGYFQLTAIPRLAGNSLHTQFEFWFSDTQITDIGTVTASAIRLGTGSLWVHDNLLPATPYWFYIRSVNVVGRSVFVEATGTPRSDAEGMLPIFREKIDQTWFGTEFYKKIDNGEMGKELTQVKEDVQKTSDGLGAMWSVKLQQLSNGQYYIAGLGVGMENTITGMQSQILMAADRIAMVNPANGNTTPLLVAQNNQLIMNDVFLKNLYAAQITSSGNPPTFSLTPDGQLTARQATISGNITATGGSFSNVTIDESCQVKHLYAEAIDGDIAKPYFLPLDGTITIPSARYARYICIPTVKAKGNYKEAVIEGNNGGTHRFSGTAIALLAVDGQDKELIRATGQSMGGNSDVSSWYTTLQAGSTMTLHYHQQNTDEGGTVSPFVMVMVFKA